MATAAAASPPGTQTRPLAATTLTARGLTPGKLRGLQRISNANGTLTMLALDQNSSMIEMARKALEAAGERRDPTYDEIVEAKLDLMRQMAPVASGVLIDGYYGAWAAVATGAVAPEKGLLVRLEKSGAAKNAAGVPLVQVEPGWSVEKIKLMGADAVKLLAPFEPTERESAEYQLAVVEQVAEECRRYDILFLLEPVAVPLGGEKRTDASFLERRAATTIESARLLSRHCDVFKAEFPGTLDHDSDEQLHDNLQALSAACDRPWVLLSAGVDYAQYLRQVEMAMEAGASGVLGGRAFWKEYFQQKSAEARTEFASTEGRRRVAEVDAIVRQRALPWFERYGLSAEDLAAIRPAEGWLFRYSPAAKAAAGSSGHAVRPGETY
jgi:tagatose 1,6-diphosphate aldolase